MYHIFFVHSSVDGHLHCFHVLAIANSEHRGAFIFLRLVLSWCMPRSGIAGTLFLVFWRTSILFSIVAALIYIPTNSVRTVSLHKELFFTPSPAFVVCILFNDDYSDWCEVVHHCSFDLHFSSNQQYWASFHVPVGHLYVSFGEMYI